MSQATVIDGPDEPDKGAEIVPISERLKMSTQERAMFEQASNGTTPVHKAIARALRGSSPDDMVVRTRAAKIAVEALRTENSLITEAVKNQELHGEVVKIEELTARWNAAEHARRAAENERDLLFEELLAEKAKGSTAQDGGAD